MITLALFAHVSADAQIPAECISYWRSVAEQSEDTETDWETDLEELFKNKIRLNSDSKEQLLAFPFFSIHIVDEIMDYRARYENFISVYELQQIRALEGVQLVHLLPFVTKQ